jgi:hypothetical protein
MDQDPNHELDPCEALLPFILRELRRASSVFVNTVIPRVRAARALAPPEH